MWNSAKYRAKTKGVPFSITPDDIIIPDECPALGIKLARSRAGTRAPAENSPTLDRIFPDKGYVPGNVIVVSNKANRIKNNASAMELVQVALFYKRLIDQLANATHRR